MAEEMEHWWNSELDDLWKLAGKYEKSFVKRNVTADTVVKYYILKITL